MPCLLCLSTPLRSNFKTLFSSRNRLRTFIDTVLLLAGRCHIGHKNTNRLHAHGSACTLVAATRDVALTMAVDLIIFKCCCKNLFSYCVILFTVPTSAVSTSLWSKLEIAISF
jgi:hypothetical protein